MKHLPMEIFCKNKDNRSKDQNKNEFDFCSSAVETNMNNPFS